jgi:hypothetical protein
MPILNYTTSISSERTISDIMKCLVKHGATKIVSDYDADGIPSALTFCLRINITLVAFSLPANYQGVLKSMELDKKIPRKFLTREQAVKVSWRIVKDWVEAQMAIVEAQLADMAEVFLPYAVTKKGNTLYSEMKTGGMAMLKQASNE